MTWNQQTRVLKVPDKNGNVNCVNSTNCKNCVNCVNCKDCHDCTNCEDCTNCSNCDSCYLCVKLDGCKNLKFESSEEIRCVSFPTSLTMENPCITPLRLDMEDYERRVMTRSSQDFGKLMGELYKNNMKSLLKKIKKDIE